MKIERSYAADRLHVREPKYKGRQSKMLYTDRSRRWHELRTFLGAAGLFYPSYIISKMDSSLMSVPLALVMSAFFFVSLCLLGISLQHQNGDLNDRNKRFLLQLAYIAGRVHGMRYWLEKGAAPEAKYLLSAAEDGYEDIVRLFLDYGADVNAKWDGKSALAWAIEKKNVAMVKLLLGRGAKVDTEWDGKSALAWAIEGGNLDIEAALVHAGADFDADSFKRSKQKGGKALFFALLGRFARKDRGPPHDSRDASEYRGALQASEDAYTDAEHAFVALILSGHVLSGHVEAALTGGCISGQPAAPNDLTAGVDCEAKLSSDELFSVICSLQDLGALKRSVSDSLPLALTSREMLRLCRDQQMINGLAAPLDAFQNGSSVDSAPQQGDRHRLEGAVCRAVFPTSPKAFPPAEEKPSPLPPAEALSALPPELLLHIGGFL